MTPEQITEDVKRALLYGETEPHRLLRHFEACRMRIRDELVAACIEGGHEVDALWVQVEGYELADRPEHPAPF